MRNVAALVPALAALLALSSCESAGERPAAPVATTAATPSSTPTTPPALASATPSAPAASPKTYAVPIARYASPGELTRALVNADRVIHDEGATDDAVAAAGQAQQRAYRQLIVTRTWREPVYAALPARLRADARDCVTAGEALRAATRPQTKLPGWRIVPAAPHGDLLRFYQESGRRHGIDWTYLAAINLVETRMGRLRGTSSAGAQGPMQFLPSTWAEVGRGNIDDPRDAIDAAARYLVRRGGRASIARGVRGYNPSDYYVRGVLSYAAVLQRDPAAYRGFYHWQVYYRMTTGDVVLLEGYRRSPAVR